jgi:hypothetical protein
MKKMARNAVASNMASVYHKFTPRLMSAGTLKKDGRLLPACVLSEDLDCGAENDFTKWKFTMHGSGGRCSRASLSSGIPRGPYSQNKKNPGRSQGEERIASIVRQIGYACCDRL